MVFSKKILLCALAGLLLAACTSRDERIAVYRDYCTKVGYASNSEGLHDCIVQMETHRPVYNHHYR